MPIEVTGLPVKQPGPGERLSGALNTRTRPRRSPQTAATQSVPVRAKASTASRVACSGGREQFGEVSAVVNRPLAVSCSMLGAAGGAPGPAPIGEANPGALGLETAAQPTAPAMRATAMMRVIQPARPSRRLRFTSPVPYRPPPAYGCRWAGGSSATGSAPSVPVRS